MALIAGMTACSEDQNKNQPQVPTETVLPSTKTVNQDYMVATGENVVFFVPSNARMEDVKATNPSIEAELQEFLSFIEEAKKALDTRKISYMISEEASFKLKINDNQFHMINATGVKEGYGIAMSKLNKRPLILKGRVSMNEFISTVDEFYEQ
jgi:hypothetical protein